MTAHHNFNSKPSQLCNVVLIKNTSPFEQQACLPFAAQLSSCPLIALLHTRHQIYIIVHGLEILYRLP